MDFPYHDVKGSISVECGRSYLYFTEEPNLVGGDIEDGYTVHHVSVRIDGVSAVWRVTQNWGGHLLYLPSAARGALAGGSVFEVNLPWYGGRARFKWDLTGSSEAILQTC